MWKGGADDGLTFHSKGPSPALKLAEAPWVQMESLRLNGDWGQGLLRVGALLECFRHRAWRQTETPRHVSGNGNRKVGHGVK